MLKSKKDKTIDAIDPKAPVVEKTKAEDIVDQAKKLSEKRGPGGTKLFGVKAKAKRRTDAEIENDKKMKELAAAVTAMSEKLFQVSIRGASYSLAKLLDDKKWMADEEEEKSLAICFRGYIELKFPNWGGTSPEGALCFALAGFLLPRFGIVDKQPIKDNPWKGWLPRLWQKIKPKKDESVSNTQLAVVSQNDKK